MWNSVDSVLTPYPSGDRDEPARRARASRRHAPTGTHACGASREPEDRGVPDCGRSPEYSYINCYTSSCLSWPCTQRGVESWTHGPQTTSGQSITEKTEKGLRQFRDAILGKERIILPRRSHATLEARQLSRINQRHFDRHWSSDQVR